MRWISVACVLWVAACGDDDGAPRDAGGERDAGGDRDTGPAVDGGGGCAADTECDDGVFCNGAESCGTTGTCVAGEAMVCDDGMACSTNACDEAMRMCTFTARDADGDGHGAAECGGDDCDDGDPLRYAGAMEICDPGNRDEDCNPATYGFQDLDADGYGAASCCNDTTCGDDCNDMAGGVHPGLPEACDDRDNDCDGMTDEDVLVTFYRDADDDGYAADGAGVESVVGCFAPAGFVRERGDCDDTARGINPGAYDSCDMAMRDENCDGIPNNPPGGCMCTSGASRMCPELGVCATGTQTCVMGTWGPCSITGTPETCNMRDDDCDGMTDEGELLTCFVDADGDGYAASGAASSTHCVCPMGTTSRAPVGTDVDCDDIMRARSPAAAEICNGLDEDCDGVADDGLPTMRLYLDRDGDGSFGTPVDRCMGSPGTSPTGGDCLDGDPSANPAQTAFFGTPSCNGGGWTPCYMGGAWACYDGMSGLGLCTYSGATPRPTPSWDFNCNGFPDPSPVTPPATTLRCGGGTCAAFTCNGEWWVDTAPPECGRYAGPGAEHYACGCGGAGGTSCTLLRPEGYFPCR